MRVPHPSAHRPLATALLLFGILSADLRGAGDHAAETGAAITDYQTLWNLQGEARAKPQRFQIDAHINYYDPVWRQLWAQEGDARFFFAPPTALPLKAGQLVRLAGVTVPARMSEVLSLSATVLAEKDAPVAAEPTGGRIADFQRHNEHWVEVEGLVESQHLDGANHLRLALSAEGTRLEAVVWLEAESPVPQYAGLTVRIRGVYHTKAGIQPSKPAIELAVPGEGCVSLLAVARQPRDQAGATATPPRAATTDAQLIVGYKQLWNLTSPARDQPQRFQIDATILHYDPYWRQIWAQDGPDTFFIAAPAARLPIRAGQLVRLTGTTIPSNFSQVSQLTTQLLATQHEPVPLNAEGRLDDHNTLNEHLVELVGYVESQNMVDANHLRCIVIAEGFRIETFVRLEESATVPLLTGTITRLRGIYSSKLRPDGSLQEISLVVPGTDRIQPIGLFHNDPRFAAPLTTIDTLPRADTAAVCHVAGRIVSIIPGAAVTLRDETGQVEVRTPQEHGLHVGNHAEAVGHALIAGTNWTLVRGLIRSPSDPGMEATAPRQLLRLAHQILELPPSRAAANLSVQIQGVVTWSDPTGRQFYLQDPSGGIRISWRDPSLAAPPRGTGLLVQGHSVMGEFAPAIEAIRLVTNFPMSPPSPRRITLEEALSGVHEALWVQMGGFLRAITEDGPTTRLHLTTTTGEFEAQAPASPAFSGWVGSFVSLNGVCVGLANQQHQLTGIRLLVPEAREVAVEEAPPGDRFAIAANALASLRQYSLLQASTHWVRTSGIVTFCQPGKLVVIQDDADALTLYPATNDTVTVGDRVDVLGIQGLDGPRFVLRQAGFRDLGPGPTVRPAPLGEADDAPADQDSVLVALTGRLEGVTEIDGQYILELHRRGDSLVARLPMPHATAPHRWKRGSTVELVGVARHTFDENRRRTGFELLLRTPEDLTVIASAPLWTTENALRIVLASLACAALAGLWSLVLRRKVGQQTEQIRQQLDKEAHLEAELERAQRLQSLGTLAGGIAHDFNNLLTAILGNLSLARMDPRVAALGGESLIAAETSAERARDLVQQMLTFARGGDPVRTEFALEPAIREAAQQAVGGSAIRTTLSAADNLPPVWADSTQVRRLVLNLLGHSAVAMPAGGTVTIRIESETVPNGLPGPLPPGRYLRTTFSDPGEAIPAEQLPSLFDPYAATKFSSQGSRFGLATAYSIAQKHGGHLSVGSQPGQGTTFTLWLPAPPRPGQASPTRPTGSARILLLDSQPAGRRLGEMLLRQLDHDPSPVATGAECLTVFRQAIADRRPFDAVILDPDSADGAETIAQLRRIDPLVCVIAAAERGHAAFVPHLREVGLTQMITKPYTAEALAAAIATGLNNDALR